METKEEITQRLERNTLLHSKIAIPVTLAFIILVVWREPIVATSGLSAEIIGTIRLGLVVVLLLSSFLFSWRQTKELRLLPGGQSGRLTSPQASQRESRVLLSMMVVGLMILVNNRVEQDHEREVRKAEQEVRIKALKVENAQIRRALAELRARRAEYQKKITELEARTPQLQRP